MAKPVINVSCEVHWWQLVEAVEHFIKHCDKKDVCLRDAEKLEQAAATIRTLLK
jgi:hypothetical protein